MEWFQRADVSTQRWTRAALGILPGATLIPPDDRARALASKRRDDRI
jgi:hypothetical protein